MFSDHELGGRHHVVGGGVYFVILIVASYLVSLAPIWLRVPAVAFLMLGAIECVRVVRGHPRQH